MSPLARSLLALAALLAAAAAKDYNCVHKQIGQKTDSIVEMHSIEIPYPDSWVAVDPSNSYCPYPLHHVGEKITVCNKNPNLPAPVVDDPGSDLTPVHITCADPSGCNVYTTEYCG